MRWPWKLSQRHGSWLSPVRKRPFTCSPKLEYLEDRFLPAWTAFGPAPQLDASNLAPAQLGLNGMPASGRISALALVDNQNVYVGSASGGVWLRTANPGQIVS
jgi:hypothetical protein